MATKAPPVFDARPLLAAALQGHDMGLVSEAGHARSGRPWLLHRAGSPRPGNPVVPLVGPVSLLLALAASGMNGQNFAFVGYLPQSGTGTHLNASASWSHLPSKPGRHRCSSGRLTAMQHCGRR